MKRVRAAGVCLAVLVVAALAARSALTPRYLGDEAGWARRWALAAGEVGRTPGEGWDRWLEAGRTLGAEPLAIDRILAAVADPWPERITPPAHAAAPDAPWAQALALIAAEIDRVAAAGDADRAVALAVAAERIERGLGIGRGLAGVAERFAAGPAVDRALRRAVSAGLFEPGGRALAELVGLNEDGGPFSIDWAVASERERALRACVEAGRPGAGPAIERLYADMAESTRGRRAAAARVEALAERPERLGAAGAFVPDLAAYLAARRAARAERVGLGVMLALERHRARTGRYPAALEVLLPVEFARLPADPFGYGEPFGYRLIDAAATRPADAYRLWSVGPDRRDDGGRPPGPDGPGDLVLNPPPGSGGSEAEP